MEARMLGAERTAERRALERKRVAAIVSVSVCVVRIEWYCGLGGVVDRKKSSVSIGSDEAQKLAQSRRRHACAKHRLRFAEEEHSLRFKLTTTTTKMNIISAISCNLTIVTPTMECHNVTRGLRWSSAATPMTLLTSYHELYLRPHLHLGYLDRTHRDLT